MLCGSIPILYKGGVWWVIYTLIGVFVPIGLNALWRKLKNKVKSDKVQISI